MKQELRNKRKKKKFTRQKNVDKWRKPKGIHSKLRLKVKGHKKSPSPGYGLPKKLKNLTKEGLQKILVYNIKDIEQIDNKTQTIVIAKAVGLKNKLAVIKKASLSNIAIYNIKDPNKFLQSIEEKLRKKKEEKVSIKGKKEKLKKEAEEKAKKKEEKSEEEKKKEEKAEKEKLLKKETKKQKQILAKEDKSTVKRRKIIGESK